MKVLKMLGLLLASVISAGVAIVCEFKEISVGSMLGSLAAGIFIPYLLPCIVDLTDNESWKSSQRKLKRAGVLQDNTIIRISFAYLFRIKIDGKYFLVPNKRTKRYQPVGGAYKFRKEEADYLSRNIPVEDDDRIPIDKITKYDYRLLVKNKDLRKFIKRFNNTEHRENVNDLSREFCEEIFSSGILDKKAFGILKYRFCGRHMTKVQYGSIFEHYELLLADVIEVKLSEEQEQLFRNLMQKKSDQYCFVNANEIKSLGAKLGTDDLADVIANHTYKILSENSNVLTMRNEYSDIFEVQL